MVTETTGNKGGVPKRLVFISHSHADRRLALALKDLVTAVFSGVVEAYVSSDPSPSGGLQPGQEWSPAIHDRLRQAEAVWVLATPTSITHPWLYWEAGMGRATCERGVVVVRVGLEQHEIPSPLTAFQNYDGRTNEIGDMFGKIADQIGMAPPKHLISHEVELWLNVASDHEPEDTDGDDEVSIGPEQVNRIEALISRLERTARAPVAPADRASRVREMRERVGGRARGLIESPDELLELLRGAPGGTTFDANRVDDDGDVVIRARLDSDRATYWARGQWIFDAGSLDFEGKAGDLARAIAEIANAHTET